MKFTNKEQDVEQLALAKQQERKEFLEEYYNDVFMGYPTFMDAVNDAQITSQVEVMQHLLQRENVFVSGLAGSGKTTVINRFVKFIDAQYDGEVRIAVTASTGIAANLLNGETIHRWAGLGISKDPFNAEEIDLSMVRKGSSLRNTDVLIIDEISMLPAYLFTKLDEALKYFRGNDEPFGGIQLILIGDFLQLPPVPTKGADSRFVIETDAWKEANIVCCYLDKTHRSKDDRLTNILLQISAGKVSENSKNLIWDRLNTPPNPHKVYSTLFTTNADVDSFNNAELAKNPNMVENFYMEKNPPISVEERKNFENFVKQMKIPERVELKIGATVMLTKNIKKDAKDIYGKPTGEPMIFSNGSLGKVISIGTIIDSGIQYVRVEFNSGETVNVFPQMYEYVVSVQRWNHLKQKTENVKVVLGTFEQIPLKLGYAITVHKSQGQTFDGVITDLSNIFQPGLGYVALSRVRTLDDLILTGSPNDKIFQVSEKGKRINLVVRNLARKARKELLSMPNYDTVMTNKFVLDMLWSNIKD